MNAREVQAVRTPTTHRETLSALASAFTLRASRFPSRTMLAVLWAQWALETGRGKACWNYNVGNMKGVSPEGTFIMLTTREVIDGKDVWVRDPFRAYSSLESGCRDFLWKLKSRFTRAWSVLLADDEATGLARAFAHALYSQKYYTELPERYAAQLGPLARECLATSPLDWPVPPPPFVIGMPPFRAGEGEHSPMHEEDENHGSDELDPRPSDSGSVPRV